MSVRLYSKSQLGKIMQSRWLNQKLHLWDEKERCMFIEHARHSNQIFKNFESSEDTQAMDHLRWMFERIHLANQLMYAKNYSHGYDKTLTIQYEVIDFNYVEMTEQELHHELYLLAYNSDEFLNENDYDKLSGWIASLASELLFRQKEIEA